MQIHKEDNMNIMKENIKLIKQITQLRKKVKELTITVKKHDRKFQNCYLISFIAKTNKGNMSGTNMEGEKQSDAGDMQNFNQSRESFDDNALQNKELQIKRQYIEQLREKLNALSEENSFLKGEFAAGGIQQDIM